jgi:hypothetical protein
VNIIKKKYIFFVSAIIPDVILKLDDELAVDLDIKTKLPSPVMLPKAVASFTPLLFNLTMLIMIYSIHTF